MNIKSVVNQYLQPTSLGIVLSLSLSGCIDFEHGNDKNEERAKVNLSLTESEADLKHYLTARYLREYEPRPEYEYAQDPLVDTGSQTESNSANESFSETNVVVAGVDESDVWKYDGEYFYIIEPAQWDYDDDSQICLESKILDSRDIMPCSYNYTKIAEAKLRIVKNTQQQMVELELTDIDPHSIYLNDDKVWVLGSQAQDNSGNYSQYYGLSVLNVYDVSNKAQPVLSASLSIDGHFYKTRRIDDEFLFVSRFYPSIEGVNTYPTSTQDVAENKRIIDAMSMSDLLPKLHINDKAHSLVNDGDCYIEQQPEDHWGASNLVITTRLKMESFEFESRCIAGDVANIHVTQSNLYLLNNSYWEYDEDTDVVTYSGKTHIHKFSLDETFSYLGSGLVPGSLGGANASFSIGELSDGKLALVTNKGSWGAPDHLLTILEQKDGALSSVATLPNSEKPAAIGKPGERIYSVRFKQNRAYIVTFQKVDPLYVIDLSDSLNPSIAGELEIPGFSDYLHPVGDDLLIGVGKDAKLGNSGTTWFQGIKVALFNVENMNKPEEVNSFILGKRGSHTALAYDHHAFSGLHIGDNYRFTFPLSINDGEPRGTYRKDPESQYYEWSYTGLQLFEIEDGQLINSGVMKTEINDGTSDYESWNIRRGLIQGDTIYHLSGSDVYKARWDEPNNISAKF
jgi:uncharacterized secreted protein with C-terminal beta-propeller domain